MILALLRRLVEATERQATYSEEIRDSYARRERQNAEDAIAQAHRLAESDAYADRQQTILEEGVKNQRAIIEKYEANLAQLRQHEARCEAWHRQHCGSPPPEDAQVVN